MPANGGADVVAEASPDAANVGSTATLPIEVVKNRAAPPRRPLLIRILRKVRWLPLIWALVALGGFIGLYFQPPGLQWMMRSTGLQPGGGTTTPIAVPVVRKTPDTAGTERRFVAGLGKILPAGDVVTVAPPFGAGDARIASFAVQEGDRVERNALLATLDNEASLQAALASARAGVASREASLRQVQSATQSSREEAQAALARVEATLANAETEFARVEQLRRQGVASQQTLDQRRAARDEARSEADRLRASLARYGSGPLDEQPDVDVAARALDAAKADLARAEADLGKAYVRAPIAGTVLTINNRAGERPSSNGIMNLGNIDTMKIEVEVYQTQIGAVAVGQDVEAVAEALPRPLRGTVQRIGLEVGRQTLVDQSPAANTDARVVKVEVALDEASTVLAQRFTNLQVTARILSGGP